VGEEGGRAAAVAEAVAEVVVVAEVVDAVDVDKANRLSF
jgi:hypothetical protein